VQVAAVVVLSVVVRSGPVRTAVNGTLVARPVRMTPGTPWRRRFNLTVASGSSSVTAASLARARRGSRQVGQHAGQLTRKVAWVVYPAFEPQPPVVIAVEVAWVERQHSDQTISVVRLVA